MTKKQEKIDKTIKDLNVELAQAQAEMAKQEIDDYKKLLALNSAKSPTNEKGAMPSNFPIYVSENQKKIDAEIDDPQEGKEQALHRLWRPATTKLRGGRVTISPGLIWMLKLHARRWKPAESCAMLIGFKDDKSKKFDVRGAVLCSNPTHSGGYFEMPPIEVVRSFNTAERHKMEIVGVFHSHPSGFEIPSSTDERFMEITPGAWIIYSWTAMRCYTLKKGRWGMNIKELTVKEIKTVEKPIIEYAYDWKTTKFPTKPKPFKWKQQWNSSGPPLIQKIRAEPGRVSWPPYWEDHNEARDYPYY